MPAHTRSADRMTPIQPTKVKGFPPHDLVGEILAAATQNTRATAARVCRLWYELAKKKIWEEPRDVAVLFNVLAPLSMDGNMCVVRRRSAILYIQVFSQLT
jgi:hypothetical protein